MYMLPSRMFFDEDFFMSDEKVRTDVYEKDGKMFVEMEAPGYNKEDIDISIEEGMLSVCLTKEVNEEENKKYLHRERRSYSKITRSFNLGDVSSDEISASFRNGVLVVSAPVKKEIQAKRTISIRDYE